jgi:pyruvate/2-oxoglutarate dehydrogenase complex dihydrolipoamide dehydrogenase (E3) component
LRYEKEDTSRTCLYANFLENRFGDPILSTVSRAERPKPLIIEESETNMTEIKAVGVVGSGQMGSGIAQLAAVHGLDVWLLDTDPAALSRATKSITSNIHRLISKGQLSQVINL